MSRQHQQQQSLCGWNENESKKNALPQMRCFILLLFFHVRFLLLIAVDDLVLLWLLAIFALRRFISLAMRQCRMYIKDRCTDSWSLLDRESIRQLYNSWTKTNFIYPHLTTHRPQVVVFHSFSYVINCYSLMKRFRK